MTVAEGVSYRALTVCQTVLCSLPRISLDLDRHPAGKVRGNRLREVK